MKRNTLIILVLFLMAFFIVGSNAQKDTKQIGQLKVTIEGLENDKGKVMVGLFASKEGYTSDKEPFKGCSSEIKDRKAECTFEGISYGTYAIKIYQDKNGNGKLDTNCMGVPEEKYGFSNNASGLLGPAKWDDAKFVFNTKSMSMEITVK